MAMVAANPELNRSLSYISSSQPRPKVHPEQELNPHADDVMAEGKDYEWQELVAGS